MASATLSATARPGTGKGAARQMRMAGRIPAVIYGHAREAQSVSIDTREFKKLIEHISAENTVVELTIDGALSRTLIREIQRHPVKRTFLHVDFQELVLGEKVTVNIPLILIGTPVGVRLGGGILDQVLREIEVLVDAANIPNHIDVDITELTIGSSLHVGDLKLPEGIEVLTEESETIVVLAAPKQAEETAVAAEPAAGEPEVIRKTKADEDDAK